MQAEQDGVQDLINFRQLHEQLHDSSKEAGKDAIRWLVMIKMQYYTQLELNAMTFIACDFVLLRINKERKHRMRFVWSGPIQVMIVSSELSFVLEIFPKDRFELINGQKMIFNLRQKHFN